MNIWLFNPYGPIPGEPWRDYRFTIIAETLAAEHHHVVWWTAAFSHHFKRQRSETWKDIAVSPHFTVRLVPAPAYRRHIGAGRIWFELMYAWRAFRRARREPAPDLILATDPPQVVGLLGATLAKLHKARLIIDVMDLWPELFALALPKPIRRFGPLLFAPLFALRRRNFRRADALIALCDSYMTVARKAASSVPTQIIYNGVRMAPLREKIKNAKPVILPKRRENEVWAIYAGTLGDNYDIPTLLEAMDLAWHSCAPLRLLIAGDGPLAKKVKRAAARRSIDNITYLGRLDPESLAAYYSHCQIGVCAYGAESNVAMPDKAYDYMAAGLAIVNSLTGELAEVLTAHQAGVSYEAGNLYSLASVLEHLAYRPAECARLGANALQAASLFDRDAQYPKLLSLLKAPASSIQ